MLFYFKNENKEIKSEHCSVYWLLFNNKNEKTNKLILFTSPKKKKKRRMRILGARIFSKFFGGKIVSF